MAGPDRVYLKRTEKYSEFVGEELQQIRHDRDFTDFQITVHETAFPCHKVTIAVHSPVLKAMLKSEMCEAAKQSIKLDHIPVDIMETILDFIYLGEISFDAEQIMGMLKAAHYLQMRLLQEMCVDEIPSRLKSSNVISWLQLGNQLDIPEIASRCAKFMVSRFTDIVAEPDFLKMTSPEVHEYFHEATSDTECDDILQATMLWVNHDAANRLTDLENLLQQVELDKCSPQTIVDMMSTYGAMIGPHVNVLNLLTEAMKQGLSSTEKRSAAKKQIKAPDDTTKPRASKETVHQTSPEHNVQTTQHEVMERCTLENMNSRIQETRKQTTKQTTQQKTEKQSPVVKLQNKQALVIVEGNANIDPSRVCWKLNEQNQFAKLCDIPFEHLPTVSHSACKCPQGFIITGGERTVLCIMYITATKSWTKLKKLLRERARHGSVYVNGVLYVLGGIISGRWRWRWSKSDSVDYLADGTWQCGPNVPIAVEYPKVAGLNGKVFLLDGHTGQLLQLSTDISVWNRCTPCPEDGASDASMISVNDQLLLAGGYNKVCAWYTPSTDTWCLSQKPKERHNHGSLVYHDNTILLLGGGWMFGGTNAVEERSENGTWSVSNIKMPRSLWYHNAFIINMEHEDWIE